jgi:Ser/Thr protein kinase RdoA (MazF antagonist)
VDDARTLPRLTTQAQAEAAGRAFGEVQVALADYPLQVPEPIPGFMQLDHYLRALDAVPDQDQPEAAAVRSEIDARRDLAGAFPAGDRLIHGDCKIDNLLFRNDGSVAFVIDLDTVMRGHWAWDFGDLARSAATAAGRFDVGRFAALGRGFVRSGAAAADPTALSLAPRYVALMLAVRFLTDHCLGDRYFKVQRHGDNLRRAREQLGVLGEMERQQQAMIDALARL